MKKNTKRVSEWKTTSREKEIRLDMRDSIAAALRSFYGTRLRLKLMEFVYFAAMYADMERITEEAFVAYCRARYRKVVAKSRSDSDE